MNLINHNGKIFKESDPVFSAKNRAFLYGDGLFETIRVFDGRIPFWDYHYKRLSRGMELLALEKSMVGRPDFLLQEISLILLPKANARVRLTVFRSGGGKYRPQTSKPSYLIQSSPVEGNQFVLNERGLRVGLYDEWPLGCGQSFHNIKSTNCLPYVMASIYADKQGWDDCLMVNREGRIAEAASSNIFVKKGEEWFTPQLSEGCVAGIMREVILKENIFKVQKTNEIKMAIDFLFEGDEVLLTNAVRGVQWVEWIGEQQYERGSINDGLLGELN